MKTEAGSIVDSTVLEVGFRPLLEASPDPSIVLDAAGRVIASNQEVERLLGWSESELLGQSISRLIPPRFHPALDRRFAVGREPELNPTTTRISLFARRRDGTELPVEINRASLGAGTDAAVLVTIRDLTEWRRAQESLFREKEQAVITLESIGDAVMTTDLAGRIMYLNPVAERLTGWRATEALGMPSATILTFISDTTREPVESTVRRCLEEGRPVDLADGVLLLRRDGTEVGVGDSAAPIRDRNGMTTGVVVVFHDVTEKRRISQRLSHEAAHDALTALVNRKEFERRLTRALGDVNESGAGGHSLCYLDLDRFKLINDACGHESGDDVLRQVAAILSTQFRQRDTVARLGGDEFGALLENCPLEEAAGIAEAVRTAIDKFRYVSGGQTFTLGISIGVIPITSASGRVAAVMKAADTACYIAKEAGGNHVFVDWPHPVLWASPPVAARPVPPVARALAEERFHLYAQPIISLLPELTARPRCEILLRLLDEHGNARPAASFLPQAERYNLMPAIDLWVIRRTVDLMGRWHKEHPGCELPLCSINLSASSLDERSLVPRLREHLAEHRLPPEALCFEIAEAAALGNFAQTVRFISEIRSTGCGIALDDFGNGLHAFTYLKALNIDFIKIGGHYVRGMIDDPVYGTIVAAVNEVGRLMGIATIAEEVESQPVLDQLRKLGIGYAQGHALAAPEPLADSEGTVSLPCMEQVT